MASKPTPIALDDKQIEYARSKVASGEFGSVDEVVHDALRLHEERSAFRSKLLEDIDQGLASPTDEEFDIDRWFDEEFGDK